MAREIIHEESIMTGKQRRLWNSSEVYNVLSEKKVPITEAVEVLFISLEKFSQKVHIDANDFARMKKLRILKIYQEEKVSELKGHNVIFSGNLYYLSNELSLFCWHGYPFKYLPSNFYPENIVAIDLSYSNIKDFWTTPKITNLEELSLEGFMNLVGVHPSIGMLKRLVVLNLRDCKRLQNFPSRVEMDALQVLNFSGCLKVDQLLEALGRIKSLTDLHINRTAITELPSFVSSLINLESLSFGGQGRIQPRWWTSITAPFGLLSKQQHQRSVSLAGNNFTSLPGSLSQLSHLFLFYVDGCKKLEVLPELPHSLEYLFASDCTSLREVLGSYKDTFRQYNNFRNCPKLLKNVSIDSEGCISKTQCLDSSITSQGFIHQLSALFGYLGFETNKHEFFFQDTDYCHLDMLYHGNSMPEWFTNRRYSVNNFDGASLSSTAVPRFRDYVENEFIGIQDSYMILLHYRRDRWGEWKEAKNFVTFSFEENSEDVEVKECGVRLICDEDIEEEADLSMLQGLPAPTQHGGTFSLSRNEGHLKWSW
ncbi:NB-ARC domains-containing protein [Artemisia annua]|uniref:NB-ARC domains-containing protein n=1 Tax=Artemisia annua TaxID=35608 RepID=A0A2U1KU79_ARTAN|nr:NB-ARC domains-containing protein [Artemisia annua]